MNESQAHDVASASIWIRARARTWGVLEPAEKGDWASLTCDATIIVLVGLNVVATIIETVESIGQRYEQEFLAFERFSIACFTIEYLLRVWSSTTDARFRHPIRGRLRFMFHPLMLIDLLAILPGLIPFVALDARALRAFRLFRIARVLKFGRYSSSLQLIGRVFRAKGSDLIVILCTLVVLLIIASSLVYFAEHDAQPQNFSSIPATMWWGIVTMTTVGYGDIYPITTLGKILGGGVALLGVGLFAMPAGILAAGFSEDFGKRRQTGSICPTCGQTTVSVAVQYDSKENPAIVSPHERIEEKV